MKGIYLTEEVLTDNGSGVTGKIRSQIRIFRENGIEITIISAKPAAGWELSIDKILRYLFFVPDYKNSKYIKILLDSLTEDTDFIYMRKLLLGKCLLKGLKKIKKKFPSLKIYMEIPTYPYDSEMTSVLRSRDIKREVPVRDQFAGVVDKIVTFSRDRIIFGIPTIRISNGVEYDKISPVMHHVDSTDINLIAVALFDVWHGYDRVIRGLKNYYEGSPEQNVILHLVGDGPALKNYRQLVHEFKLNQKVRFYGKLSGASLDEIYQISDIALDAMGRHRSNVYFNSSLKGKEYCAKGLPIVSGVETELDFYEEYPYYFRIPADESAVDITSVIRFYYRVYGGSVHKEIADAVRKKTIAMFDMNRTFLSVIESLKEECARTEN